MDTWEVNLCNIENAMLIGDVGEVIALHYLSSHGFLIVCRPLKLLHGKLSLISAHYQINPPKMNYRRWLTDEQKEYLENFPSWDYVAFKRSTEKDWRKPHLVEVKTVRGEGRPHKKPRSNSVSRAKALGFKPLLIIVRLLESWNTLTEVSEL